MYIYIDTDLIYIYYTVYVSANMYIYIYMVSKVLCFSPTRLFRKMASTRRRARSVLP